LNVPKYHSEDINRRTDNATAYRKGTDKNQILVIQHDCDM